MDVLFVCLGNICRSPLAAGIMQALYREHSLAGIVESAGTADFNIGCPADHRSIAVAHENGIDLRDHRARQICKADFQKFDHIFAMDNQNNHSLMRIAPDKSSREKIALLAEKIEIADPYHSNIEAFRTAFSIMKVHCHKRLLLHADMK